MERGIGIRAAKLLEPRNETYRGGPLRSGGNHSPVSALDG